MAEFPAMPFWTDAYLSDTGHLTNEEHGLYLRLLILLWRSPGQRIPNDAKWLKRRFGEDAVAVLRLCHEFCKCEEWITQSRLSREFQFVAEQSEKQRKKAKSRWRKDKSISHGNAVAEPGLSRGNAPTPTPTPTPTPLKIERKIEANGHGNWMGEGRKRKPRNRQKTKDGLRIWFDKGTDEFKAYASDYFDKHHASVVLLWNGSGAWFNINGEPDEKH